MWGPELDPQKPHKRLSKHIPWGWWHRLGIKSRQIDPDSPSTGQLSKPMRATILRGMTFRLFSRLHTCAPRQKHTFKHTYVCKKIKKGIVRAWKPCSYSPSVLNRATMAVSRTFLHRFVRVLTIPALELLFVVSF